MRNIKYKSAELKLITLPAIDVDDYTGEYQYSARAKDEGGIYYKIIWKLSEIPQAYLLIENITVPCDWDEYEAIPIGHNPIETTNDYPGITNAKYLIDSSGHVGSRQQWWESGRGDTDMPGLWDEGLEEISAFDYFHLKSFAPPDEKLKEPANPVVEKLKEELEKFRKQVGELTTEDIENLAVKMGRGAKGWAQAISVFGLNTFMADVDYLTWEGENSKY